MNPGRFEVYPDRASKWRWRLKAPNGAVLASGMAYQNKANAIKACEAVQRAAFRATVTEQEGP